MTRPLRRATGHQSLEQEKHTILRLITLDFSTGMVGGGGAPHRLFIPQHAVDVSAPLATHVMSDSKVPQKQYPEYQHEYWISDQPVLGEECDKAKEQ